MRVTIASRNDRRSKEWNRVVQRALLCALITSTSASSFGDESAKGPVRSNPYIKTEAAIKRPTPAVQLASGTAITLKPRSRTGLIKIGDATQVPPVPQTAKAASAPSTPVPSGAAQAPTAALRELIAPQPAAPNATTDSLPIIHYGGTAPPAVTEAFDRMEQNAFDAHRQRGVVTIDSTNTPMNRAASAAAESAAVPTAAPQVVRPENQAAPAEAIRTVADSRDEKEFVEATQPIFFSLTDVQPTTPAEVEAVESALETAEDVTNSPPSVADTTQDETKVEGEVTGSSASSPVDFQLQHSTDAETIASNEPDNAAETVDADASEAPLAVEPTMPKQVPVGAPVEALVLESNHDTTPLLPKPDSVAEDVPALVQLAEPVALSPIDGSEPAADLEAPASPSDKVAPSAMPKSIAAQTPVVRFNPNVVRNDSLARFRSNVEKEPAQIVRTTRPPVAVSALPIAVERTEEDMAPTVGAALSDPLEDIAAGIEADVNALSVDEPISVQPAVAPTLVTGTDNVSMEPPVEMTPVDSVIPDFVREEQAELTPAVVSVASAPRTPFQTATNAPEPTVTGPVAQTQEAPASEVTLHLTRAQVRSMTIGGRLRRVSISNKDVCQAFASSSNQIKLIGTGLGKTSLTIWADVEPTEPTRVQTFVIEVAEAVDAKGDKVSENTKLLNDSITRAFPTANVVVQRQGSELVVRGTCRDEESAKQIIRMVRKSCLVPVNDQLSIR
ncbi:MAG: pilus assembly protein N-terminal domain-containing protein [Planctomycetota bacterium]